MTEIQLNFNNLSESEALFSLFPASDKYEFIAKKVFRLKYHIFYVVKSAKISEITQKLKYAFLMIILNTKNNFLAICHSTH